MCGITGIYNLDKKNLISGDQLKDMNRLISHRGPDDKGFFIQNNVGLAHNRLSIIDIKHGHQPMFSPNNNFVIVFNGEIYNYKELKKELISLGYHFKTNSDTEVVLQAYHEWGSDCCVKFNGMFAIAIWDMRKQELFLARDRFGIKPLYYMKDKKSIIFSSEIKGFKSILNFEYNLVELWDLLVFGPKAGGKTHIKKINELEPGNFIIASKNRITKKEYYSLENTFLKIPKKNYLEKIENLLLDSVNIRLMSEVPLGSLNSGGLDSSIISSMAQKNITGNLNTFSISPISSYGNLLPGDETLHAEKLAASILSNHKSITYYEEEFIKQLQKTIYFHDFILYHSSSVPTSIMCDKIKNDHKITVILTGDGADEVFMGYSHFKYANLYNVLKNFPFGEYIAKKTIENKFERWDKNLELIENYQFLQKISFFHNSQIKGKIVNKLLGIKGGISEDRIKLIDKSKNLSEMNKMIYYDEKCYLSGSLQRVDRMSMQWGVEARVPFLDHRLVGLVNSIDFKKKSGIRNISTKKLLKNFANKYVPQDILKRKKQGFATPIQVFKNKFVKKLQIDKIIDFKDITQNNELNFYEIFLLYNYSLMTKQLNKVC